MAPSQPMGVGGAPVKVAVVGLWHLGCVTAGCLTEAGHNVVGIDSEVPSGRAPVFEPGLDELLQRVRFTTDISAVRDAQVIWITFDTPVDQDDRADVEFVV